MEDISAMVWHLFDADPDPDPDPDPTFCFDPDPDPDSDITLKLLATMKGACTQYRYR